MILRRAFMLWTATALLWSCAARTPAAVIPEDLYQPAGRDLPATASHRRWIEVSQAVGLATPLPILSSVALPPGARDLRLIADESGMIWHPVPLLRLVEWDRHAAGELYLFWPRLKDSTGRAMNPYWVTHEQYGCRRVQQTDQWASCRIQPRKGTSWRRVADSLSALTVWALPPNNVEDRRGSSASDQDMVRGEMLIGGEYRRFHYYDLDRLTGDDVPRVRAAARLVTALLPK